MAALRLGSISIVIVVALVSGLLLSVLPERLSRPCSRFLRRAFCSLGCRALGIRVEVQGAWPSTAPTLLVSNHISWTDVLALGSIAPIVFTARHDLADWPVLGPISRAYGTLFVNRARRRSIPDTNRQMAARLAEHEIVVLFPEATTGDGTRLRKFNSPHFAAAHDLLRSRQDIVSVAIAPASIAYTRRRGLPLGRNGRAAVAWYGDTEFAPHLFDLACAGPTRCRIRLLEPIWFGAKSDRKQVAREAAVAIRTAFVADIMDVAPKRATDYVQSVQQAL